MKRPVDPTSQLSASSSAFLTSGLPLTTKILTLHHVQYIDDIIQGMDGSGEVRLVKAKGKLRFIQRITTEDIVL
jgi:hypothetical protein